MNYILVLYQASSMVLPSCTMYRHLLGASALPNGGQQTVPGPSFLPTLLQAMQISYGLPFLGLIVVLLLGSNS